MEYSPFASRKSRRRFRDDIESCSPHRPRNLGSSIPVAPIAPMLDDSDDRPGPSVSQVPHTAGKPDNRIRRPLQWAARLRNKHATPPFAGGTTIGTHFRVVLLHNYASAFLLPFIPAGFVVNYISTNATVIFCVNFVAIFPSATILSAALKDLNIRMGQRLGALVNQTFGYGLGHAQSTGRNLTNLQQHCSVDSIYPPPQIRPD